MEADAALVGTDGIVVLHTVTHVGLHLSLVIYPCHTELIYAVRYAEAFYQVGFLKLRVLVVLFFDSGQYLFDCLMVLRFIREASLEIFQDFLCVHS